MQLTGRSYDALLLLHLENMKNGFLLFVLSKELWKLFVESSYYSFVMLPILFVDSAPLRFELGECSRFCWTSGPQTRDYFFPSYQICYIPQGLVIISIFMQLWEQLYQIIHSAAVCKDLLNIPFSLSFSKAWVVRNAVCPRIYWKVFSSY